MQPSFHYSRSGQKLGPVSFQELQQQAAAGTLLPADMVLAEGSTQWARADAIPGLAFPPLDAAPPDPSLKPGGQKRDEALVQEYLQDLKRRAATPWATFTFAGICLGVYVMMIATGVDPFTPLIQQLLAWGADYRPLVLEGQYWRPLTSTFVHIGLIHLAMNMWVLCDGGPLVERLFGTSRFVLLYLLSGILGSAASLLWNGTVVSAGASGAIFGVYGGLLAFLLRNPGAVPVPVLRHFSRSTLGFLAYNLLIGFTLAFVDNAAHLGGLVGGFLCGFGLAPRRPAYHESTDPASPDELPAKPTTEARWQPLAGIAVVAITLGAFYAFSGDGQVGTKLTFGKGELYYKSPVTEAQAQNLGRALQDVGFFTNLREATVQVQKTGPTYEVRFVVIPSALTDPDMEAAFREVGGKFKAVFDQQPVEIHLCDDMLRTKKVIGL